MSSPIIISICSSALPEKWTQNRQTSLLNTKTYWSNTKWHIQIIALASLKSRAKTKNWAIKVHTVTFGGKRKTNLRQSLRLRQTLVWTEDMTKWFIASKLFLLYFSCPLFFVVSRVHTWCRDKLRTLAIPWNFISSFVYFFARYVCRFACKQLLDITFW